MTSVFHLAYPVKDKEETRAFYAGVLGCNQGREADTWIDFDFFGHQVSFHVKPEAFSSVEPTNPVDGKNVPVRHFGAVLRWDEWHDLKARLIEAKTDFVIEPYIRFKGETGEQATMFFLDPSGNALEFKSFKDPNQIFAT
ncbi:VOC family protein [Hellea balneolensis]|uniref:VOC family protein n=1 Tax=Hellea balneolensis TaxID=287478 RepID=UPI0004095AA2|nr:VOC family protein [Hellea balneolensis]